MKFWEVLKAVDEGKTVQFYSDINKKWQETVGIDNWRKFEADKFQWRIKPEPMVIYKNLYKGGFSGPCHKSLEAAKIGPYYSNGDIDPKFIRTVKFVEVMED